MQNDSKWFDDNDAKISWNVVLCCVGSYTDRTDIFFHVTDMLVTCLKSAKFQGRNKYFKHAFFFFVCAMHLPYYKELKNAIKIRMTFFLPVILWYAPGIWILWWCVSDTDTFFWKFTDRTEIYDMLVTCHQHFQLRCDIHFKFVVTNCISNYDNHLLCCILYPTSPTYRVNIEITSIFLSGYTSLTKGNNRHPNTADKTQFNDEHGKVPGNVNKLGGMTATTVDSTTTKCYPAMGWGNPIYCGSRCRWGVNFRTLYQTYCRSGGT